MIAVHEAIEGGPPAQDRIAEMQRLPYFFILRNWGNHMITKPLESLEGLLFPICLVEFGKEAGVNAHHAGSPDASMCGRNQRH